MVPPHCKFAVCNIDNIAGGFSPNGLRHSDPPAEEEKNTLNQSAFTSLQPSRPPLSYDEKWSTVNNSTYDKGGHLLTRRELAG